MTQTPSTITLSAEWEHDIVAPSHGATSLVLHLRTPDSLATSRSRAPLDLAFALDRSGSMQGADKIDLVKRAVMMATDHLTEDDRVSLVIYDTEIDVIHELAEMTPYGRHHLVRALGPVEARGGTNLAGGWLTACQQLATAVPIRGPKRISRTILLTDGQANQGETDPGRLAAHASALRARGIATTTVGVGYGFDEFLLSGMAEAGGGNFQFVDTAASVEQFFQREIGELGDIVAVMPTLHITFPEGMRGRLVTPFPVDRSGHTVKVELRDISARDRVDLVFDITVHGGVDAAELAPTISLRWHEPATGSRQQIQESTPAIRTGDAATATRNDAAGTIAAMQRADRDRREATRLDRAGRFAESRSMFRAAADTLAHAPIAGEYSADAARLRSETEAYAGMSAPMTEEHRKRLMSESMRRGRGDRNRQ